MMHFRFQSLIMILVLAAMCMMGTGCLYLDGLNAVKHSSDLGYFGYNKDITINTEPQGADVLIELKNGTYQKLGTTPLKFPINFNTGTNCYDYVTIVKSGYHVQKLNLLKWYSVRANGDRENLTSYFIFDTLFVIPILGNLLNAPRALFISEEAYTCDLLGVKVVYDSSPIYLINGNTPLPQMQEQVTYTDSNNDAAIISALILGAGNVAAAAMSKPAYTPPPPTPRPTPAPPAQTNTQRTVTPTTPNFKRFCPRTYKNGVVHGEWDSRFSAGCPACRGTINL